MQRRLGADIQMVLDVCPPLPSEPSGGAHRGRAHGPVGPAGPGRLPGRTRRRGDRRPNAARPSSASCRAASTPTCAVESAEADASRSASTATASAACRWASRGTRCCPALEVVTAGLPADQPRYLMGVGDPIGFVEGIARGVDMFDCVLATRLGPPRHDPDRRRPAQPAQRRARPQTPGRSTTRCACPVCGRWSRAYLRHLLRVREPTAARLLTIHNLHWCLDAHAAGPGRHPRGPVRGAPGRDRRRSGPDRAGTADRHVTGPAGAACRVGRAWRDPGLTCVPLRSTWPTRAVVSQSVWDPMGAVTHPRHWRAAVRGADRPAPARDPPPPRRWWRRSPWATR